MNTCILCGPTEKKLNSRGFCHVCYAKLERKAFVRQTREDMHGWLHTRADRYGRPFTDDRHDAAMVRRRVAVARRAGIEWWEPIQRHVYQALLDDIVKEAGGQTSRAGKAFREKKKADSITVSAV